MKRTLWSLVVILLLAPHSSQASIPPVYTNENFWTSTHDAPVQLFRQENGDFYGFTRSGKYFRQTRITNDSNVLLYRFAIDQAYFYMTDRGLIQAKDDLTALSVYLTHSVT